MKARNIVPYEPLTTREMDILSLIVSGSSNREIAETLFIAHSTVRWYIRQIYSKLGVETRTQAIELAVNEGLTLPEIEIASAVKHNLPVQTNAFVGRDRELDALASMIADPDLRLITIVAPGGMGKTRLALSLVERVMALPQRIEETPNRAVSFQDGVFFVPLASLTTPDLVISTIVDSIGYRFQPDGRDLKQQLLDFLHEKQILLVLDNAEHLRDGMGIVSEILAYAKDIQIVVTSRERLNLNAETVYTIAGLPLGDWETLTGALASDCVKLFLQSAKRVKPGFTLAADEIDSLAHVCQLVDGMPLAIELAAAWVAMLSLEEIAGEIGQNLDFLASDLQDTPQRQHSIRAVFEYTWKRLSTAEQTVLMKLSVFRGGWTREAAEEVAEADLLLLRALVSKSLIDHGADGRFEMQGLLHQFTEEQLEIAEETTATRVNHSAYFADHLYRLKQQLRGKEQMAVLDIIERDIENVRAGWHQAVEQRMVDVLEQYLESLYYFYDIRSRANEGAEMFSLAVKSLGQAKLMGNRLILFAKILARQGSLVHRLGQYQLATQLLEAGLQILRQHDVQEEIAFVLNNLADLHRPSGNFQMAQQLCEESLAIFQALGDEWSITSTLNNLGVTTHYLEQFPEAEKYYRQSLAFAKRLDDQHGVATALINLGALAHDWEDYEAAQGHYEESLLLSEQLNDLYGVAASLTNLGRTAFMLNAYAEGRQYCEESLDLYRQLGSLWGIAASLINLGDIDCALGNLPEARHYFHEALKKARVIQAEPLVVEVAVGMADLLTREEKNEQALTLLVPIVQNPPGDREIRIRADRLWSRLIEELPDEISTSIQEDHQTQSLEAVARQILKL